MFPISVVLQLRRHWLVGWTRNGPTHCRVDHLVGALGRPAPHNANSWNWIAQWWQHRSNVGFEVLLALSVVATASQWTRLKSDHAFRNATLLAYIGIGYVS